MCGIIGIVGKAGSHINQHLYDGLTVLQHRGQDAAGIVTEYKGKFHLRKSNGLASEIFRGSHMKRLLGNIGVGHVRYPTAGSSSRAEAKPFYVNSPYGIAFAHNGNLTNASNLEKMLVNDYNRHVNTNSDSELLLNIFAVELAKNVKNFKIEGEPHMDVKHVFSAIRSINQTITGGYACIGMIAGYGLVAFRDPYGIRPLIFGKREVSGSTEWVVASESVAITALGFEVVRDVKPGEAIFISNSGHLFAEQCAEAKPHSPCIFEYVYFARPDSVIDGISVYQSRLNQGDILAKQIMETHPDLEVDAVIPIPDSGRIAALQLAKSLGVPYREGFVKNRYVGRTFIMPGQALREKSVRRKLNAIPDEFKGKKVLLVDDSIVRGTTSAQIVEMARDVGAEKVYFSSAAPPVRYPNVYGIDMPAKSEFIADNKTIEEIREEIGADELFYQSLEDLISSTASSSANPPVRFDSSCFDGDYVTGDVSVEYLNALEEARNDSAKQRLNPDEEVLDIHNDQQ